MATEKESPIGNFIDNMVDKIFSIGEKALWYTAIALFVYVAFCVFLFFQIKNIDTQYEFVRALFLVLAVLVLLFTLSLPVRFIFALLSAKLLKGNKKEKDEENSSTSADSKKSEKKISGDSNSETDHWIIRALRSKPMQIIWKVLIAVLIIYFLHWVFTGHWSLNGGFFPKTWETLTGQSPDEISEKAKIKAEKEIRLEELRNQENDKRRDEREAIREYRREQWSNSGGNNESTNSSHDENSNSGSGSEYQTLDPSQMTPNSSIQTPQHPDNGWGPESQKPHNNAGGLDPSQMVPLSQFQQ